MAAVNYFASVPKLNGRENYQEWVFAIENVLVLEGLDKCVDGSELDSVLLAKAKAKLILTMEPSLYTHVRDAKTPKEVWTKLKNLYDDSGFTRKIGLLRTLISARLENHDSMESYITQVVETSQKLKRTGFNIDDEWVGSLLLAGLPPKYSPMIMAVEHSGIKITTDAIKSKLLDMHADGGSQGHGEAFSAKSNARKGKQFQRWSRDGGRSSDSNSRSYVNENNQRFENNVNKKDRSNITCFKCKEKGHYVSQCLNKKVTYALSAVFANGSFSNTDWYIDSGASFHLTASDNDLIDKRKPELREILCANEAKLAVESAGDVRMETMVRGKSVNVLLQNVHFIPGLTTNLVSVSQLIRNGARVNFHDTGCEIFNKNNVLVGVADLKNNVYKLRLNNKNSTALLAAPMVTPDLWHRRLGHINSDFLIKMPEVVEGMPPFKLGEKIQKSNCEVCCEAKQNRLPFPAKGSRASDVLEIIHSDVCGPHEKLSIGGSRYFLTFIDDYSRMCFIYFLKSKDEVPEKFHQFRCLVEKQRNKRIKILRTDNGGEYIGRDFQNYLKNNGIVHQRTNSYTPEQNGMAERFNRTIVERARCLLFDQNLGKQFWAEASKTACHLINRSVTSSISKTPYEMWHNKKPDISSIRVFGSTAMSHVPKENRQKWDKKAVKCILVGFDDHTKGYRLYNPNSRKVFISRDVTIMENIKKSVALNIEEPVQEVTDSVGVSASKMEDFKENGQPTDELDDSEPETTSGISNDQPRRSQRQRKKKVDPDFVTYACGGHNSAIGNPKSVSEALSSPDSIFWKSAIEEELQSFEENQVWELVETERDVTVVDSRWVFKRKSSADGEVKYRARLVAKGFTQKYGIDYNETFSPVVRYSTLRILFALTVKLNLDIRHLDIKTAFLNGNLSEKVFMKIPEGFICSESDKCKVLKLNKAIYGLKQSAKCWNDRINSVLLELGYTKSQYESCLFSKKVENSFIVITLYVDDFFIFSNDVMETNNLKDELSKIFKVKDLGVVRECLGMNVNYDKEQGILTLNQESYIDQILNEFNMSECNIIKTPMECNISLENGDQDQLSMYPYQNLIGSLMYLAVIARPDIAFSVSYLSQFNRSYSQLHWKHAKRILKYLKGTKHYCLRFSKENMELVGFVDADWGNNSIDRKSYTGYAFKFCGSVVSWQSCKQKTVALSSTEAEYMAISEAVKEAIYLKGLLYELMGTALCVNLFSDNQGAIKLSANDTYHKRSKHIDIRHHFVRQVIAEKQIVLKHLPTHEMPADILTKSLPAVKHNYFSKMLGIHDM